MELIDYFFDIMEHKHRRHGREAPLTEKENFIKIFEMMLKARENTLKELEKKLVETKRDKRNTKSDPASKELNLNEIINDFKFARNSLNSNFSWNNLMDLGLDNDEMIGNLTWPLPTEKLITTPPTNNINKENCNCRNAIISMTCIFGGLTILLLVIGKIFISKTRKNQNRI